MLIAGRYRLLDLVGRGGMGRVWRARDEMLHREVAVKEVVPPSWLADHERAELRSRTLREARAAARLNHPAVVRLYDVVPVEDSPWIVMEYVPSHTLQDVLDDEGPLDPVRAARIGLALLDALHAAHTAGVLHRDVKPQNVLMAHDGRVLLADFGLATFDGGDGATTRPGMVLGSPQYVSPERAAEGVSTVAADLWSLGATLHAAVEGRSPYARSTAMATLTALAAGPPDPAPHAGPLAPVLAGLLRRDPLHRLDHDEARRLLTAAANGVTGPPPMADAAASARDQDDRPGGPTDAPVPAVGRSVRRRAALIVTALLVAAAAGVGTALAVTGDEPTGTAGRSTTAPPLDRPRDGGGQDGPFGPGGPGPGRPGPPPGARVPPPPFPCVRPDIGGAPVPAGSPAAGERFRPPAGWVWHADTTGFRVSVPASWRYSREGAVACFQDPATGRTFSVAEGGTNDPLARLRAARDAADGYGALPGYDEVRLAASGGGAEWECRWDAPYGARLHARQQVLGRPGGASRWMLGWITDDRDWAAAQADWTQVRNSFRSPL
ncbi:serine/threonine protein kinase [Micromonospora sp. RHAY321]|uniref:serine/threonine-protein kinase n=1 Tax=Micromonospora sp. RHAY321 TaxID=2944807 RepID=UPI00207D40C5|nr:serine/threonine-protein kinase [Micromonospora sp. RHAY321]MCO1597718.1 serine/threonine protein kinase [Micromonospora sp. RHAY321]